MSQFFWLALFVFGRLSLRPDDLFEHALEFFTGFIGPKLPSGFFEPLGLGRFTRLSL